MSGDEFPCWICTAAATEHGYPDDAAMFCNDEHTADALSLAEALGKAVQEGDDVPIDNLQAHIEDAVAMISDGARKVGDVWNVQLYHESDLEDTPLSGLVDGPLILVGNDLLFGFDPNAEGFNPPERLDRLLVGRFL